jgi:hypothetical protein
MNMDETKLYSWFLGPKAENADMLERLVLEALRDCVFWRRNFHPEDDIIITEKCKREDAFQDSLALVRQEFLSLLANLKRDIPFYSPRYIGHMLGDQLLPAIDAHFAAMLSTTSDLGGIRLDPQACNPTFSFLHFVRGCSQVLKLLQSEERRWITANIHLLRRCDSTSIVSGRSPVSVTTRTASQAA